MRRFVVAVFLLVLSVSTIAGGQGLRTENRDGTWWRTVDAGEKAVYVTGLRDGAVLGLFYSVPKREETSASPCRAAVMTNFEERRAFLDDLTVAELVKGLDQFYADRMNANVIIPSALFYLSRRAAGDQPDKLNALLAGFRNAGR